MKPDIFALVCFLVLMENGGGLIDKSPSYIVEKAPMMFDGLDAFAKLDIHNMRKALAWCDTWHVEVPSILRNALQREEEALALLKAKGIEL